MWHSKIIVAVWLTGASSAFAQCSCGGTAVAADAVLPTIAGKTACAVLNGERWQEYHSGSTLAGGPLIDWKLGPGHPVDPTEQVGTWSIVGLGVTRTGPRVRYDYGSGGQYEYQLCQSGQTYNFCRFTGRDTRDIVGATLRAGQVACP